MKYSTSYLREAEDLVGEADKQINSTVQYECHYQVCRPFS